MGSTTKMCIYFDIAFTGVCNLNVIANSHNQPSYWKFRKMNTEMLWKRSEVEWTKQMKYRSTITKRMVIYCNACYVMSFDSTLYFISLGLYLFNCKRCDEIKSKKQKQKYELNAKWIHKRKLYLLVRTEFVSNQMN